MKSAPIGRGGKRGKTSGRGTKGQNARAGNKKRPEIRDAIKKLPKLRGYFFSPIEKKALVAINLSDIERLFDTGSVVSPKTLAEKGAIKKNLAHRAAVKILAKGSLSKKVTVENCLVSAAAAEAITKAGGVAK